MKRVLITGAGSYVGGKVRERLEREPEKFQVEELDVRDPSWREHDFSGYDCVYHVAGIAHVSADPSMKDLYMAVNRDLAIEVGQIAKTAGVRQLIFMSSSIVYGDSDPCDVFRPITKETPVNPSNYYGLSKVEAEIGLMELCDDHFRVAILRCPMIYGPGCKGNFPTLAKLAKTSPVFPRIKNRRSMLYVGNLAELIAVLVDLGISGLFLPQNGEWSSTSELIKAIGDVYGRKVCLTPMFNGMLSTLLKSVDLLKKAFGNLYYDPSCSSAELGYQVVSLTDSIAVTCGQYFKDAGVLNDKSAVLSRGGTQSRTHSKTIWIIDHYSSEPRFGGIQRQFDFANELSNRGYRTVIVSSSFSHYTHSYISEHDCWVSHFSENAQYAYVRTTPYNSNNGIGRIKNMLSFPMAVRRHRKAIASECGEPDVVLGCSVHPLAWVAAQRIAKRYGVRFVAEVRDLWPEMWLLNGEKKPYDPMVLFFGSLERWAFRKADHVVYSMLYGDKYLCGKLGLPKEKVALIGQPMDCQRFDDNAVNQANSVPQEIAEFVRDSFVCVFTGYYMEYEGVYVMLEAAKMLRDTGIPVKFLFVGSGHEEQGMREYVERNHLDNVCIHGRINKEIIPSVLKTCDVCLAHCSTKGHDESFKYGVSKNKVNEYLYSGNPVIYGRDDPNDPVATCGGGYVIKPFNPKELTERIIEVYKMPANQRKAMGEKGRKYTIEYHSVGMLTEALLKVLEI